MSRRRWIAWSAGAVAALILLAVLGISWFSGQALLHPARARSARTPLTVGLMWTNVTFNSTDGVPLSGWWIPADDSPADNGTILFLHGYGESKNQSLQVAPFLHAAGYNVLAFDLRACGQSGGSYTTAGLLEPRDVIGAVRWLTNQSGFPTDPWIVLFGWSMGGATAIRSAPLIPEVDGVIADSAFSRLQNIVDTSISHFFKETTGVALPRWPFGPLAVTFAGWSIGVDISKDRPAQDLATYHRPVLLIQGMMDKTVLPNNVGQLSAADPQAEVLRVPGAGHVGSHRVDPSLYESTVLGFLATVHSGP